MRKMGGWEEASNLTPQGLLLGIELLLRVMMIVGIVVLVFRGSEKHEEWQT